MTQVGFPQQHVTIELDGTPYPAVIDVLLSRNGRKGPWLWTANGGLTDQPDPAPKPDPDPASPEAALLLASIGQERTIVTQYGEATIRVDTADVYGHFVSRGTSTPPWPLPGGHVAPV